MASDTYESDAFEVTSYSQSAAAKLLPESPKLGGITATFAACWPKNMRPPAGRAGSPDWRSVAAKNWYGRGPLVRAGYEEVEMHMGAVRSGRECAVHAIGAMMNLILVGACLWAVANCGIQAPAVRALT